MDVKIAFFAVVGLMICCGTCGNELNTTKTSDKRFIDTPEINLEAEFTKLKAEFEAFKKSSQSSTFTRWGKNDCPNIADFVYRGYSAGRKYNDQGGPSNNLCLPTDPAWGLYTDRHDSLHSQIYGSELDNSGSEHVFNKNVLNEDMPCVVCRTSYQTTIMLPARVLCYSGWTMQYSGYLATNLNGPGRASYDAICLDHNPDFLPHGHGNDNQHIFYLMEARCGSLPCPPYVDNRELPCVVCSK